MKNYILLNDDKSVSVLKHTKSVPYKNCKYVLTTIEDLESNVFVAVEPCKTLFKTTKAVIKFEMIITESDVGAELVTDKALLEETVKEFYTPYDIINYLHSLNRIRYVNKLSNGNEIGLYSVIEFSQFSIHLYDKDECIYDYVFTGGFNNKRGPEDILDAIKKIYKPILFGNSDFLLISNNEWSFVKSISNKNSIYGVSLQDTKSIYFMDYKKFKTLRSINTLLTGSYQYSKEFNPNWSSEDLITKTFEVIQEELPRECAFRFYDIWLHSAADIIEYILYVKTVYKTLLIIAEYENYNHVTDSIMMVSWIEFEPIEFDTNRDIKFEFTMENVPSIEDIYQLILKEWR